MDLIKTVPGKPLQPEVSVLIPAYLAAGFIDRTLNFARGQTFDNLAIIVSVDAGNDNTADIARGYADTDARIEVYEHEERLGWAGNVNFLIENVETPFFFLYFHDDIILPQYIERLLLLLRNDPEAAGAYCDMGHFGASDHVSVGPAYTGTRVHRLLLMMLSRERGSPLRALLSSKRAGHLRMPDMGNGGFWANEPFLMDMLAAGSVHHLPEMLYLRWARRAGGLTDGWKNLKPQFVLNGWRDNIESRLRIIEKTTGNEAERRALRFALFLQTFPVMQTLYAEYGSDMLQSPMDLHTVFQEPQTPDSLAAFGEEIRTLGTERYSWCKEQHLYGNR
jgi:glycosyltransferase involved in cell wall biosynthesis